MSLLGRELTKFFFDGNSYQLWIPGTRGGTGHYVLAGEYGNVGQYTVAVSYGQPVTKLAMTGSSIQSTSTQTQTATSSPSTLTVNASAGQVAQQTQSTTTMRTGSSETLENSVLETQTESEPILSAVLRKNRTTSGKGVHSSSPLALSALDLVYEKWGDAGDIF